MNDSRLGLLQDCAAQRCSLEKPSCAASGLASRRGHWWTSGAMWSLQKRAWQAQRMGRKSLRLQDESEQWAPTAGRASDMAVWGRVKGRMSVARPATSASALAFPHHEP